MWKKTNIQTACHPSHHWCVMQCKPGTESAVVNDKLSLAFSHQHDFLFKGYRLQEGSRAWQKA